jgi:hypothetical protein
LDLRKGNVTGKSKILHIEEIIKAILRQILLGGVKSRRMIWAEHVARMGDREDIA